MVSAIDIKDGKKIRTIIEALGKANHPAARKIEQALQHATLDNAEVASGLFRAIEAEREAFASNDSPIHDGSLGAGCPLDNVTYAKAAAASKSFWQALRLHYLIREFRPATIIELGTNLGISSAYLGLACKRNGRGTVITLDSSVYRAKIAKGLHQRLGLENIQYVRGAFSDTFTGTLKKHQPVDFAFIDGDHQYQPTLDYFNEVLKYTADEAILVFDDITWSDGMVKAWAEIQRDSRLSLVVDLGILGIAVAEKNKKSGVPLRVVAPASIPTRIKSVVNKVIRIGN